MKKQLIGIIASVVSWVALSSCSATADSNSDTNAKKAIMEPLHSVSISTSSLKISVTSNGCTKKEHFDFVIEPGDVKQLSIVRNKYDGCRRVPNQVSFKYALTEIGLSEKEAVIVRNPIVAFKKQTFSKASKN
ncbi:MAG: hypothetical protein AB8B81_08185 [Halioglobus sp.]